MSAQQTRGMCRKPNSRVANMTIKTLQAGRALAAIAVAAFHLSLGMGLARYGGQEVFREYTNLGNRGVDFFFVLSGFIISYAHVGDIGKPETWKHYIHRRFIRLFPIYWLYTALFVLVLALLGGTDAKMPTTLWDWVTALSLIRFTDGSPPLEVAWTLFHELAFYIVFSTLILNRRAGLVALGLFMAFTISFFHYQGADRPTALNVYSAAYNFHFLLGMGAFWLYRRGGRGIAEFTLGLFISTVALSTTSLPNQLSPLFLALGFALVLAGATKLELSGDLRIPQFLGLIGDASYTIYLTHVSLQGVLLKIAMKTHLHQAIGSGATFIVVLLGTILLGCFLYLTLEQPLLNALRGSNKQRLPRNTTVLPHSPIIVAPGIELRE